MSKSVTELWHALLLIIPITLDGIWFLIRNVNLPKEKKAGLFLHTNAKIWTHSQRTRAEKVRS